MPTTRSQAAKQDTKLEDVGVTVGHKREVDEVKEETPTKPEKAAASAGEGAEPPAKKPKTDPEEEGKSKKSKPKGDIDYSPKVGTIERGHIYFFYRPKVELEEAHDLDEVQRFHILLVPRPPAFASSDCDPNATKPEKDEDAEMTVLQDGMDAVPAPESKGQSKKRFRMISVGKKELPHADEPGQGRRKQTLWATVTTVGNDLHKLEEGLGPKEYETKTRGTRHQAPARLAGRGVYAIVNNNPSVPSKRATHLGYHLSHPSEQGDVQTELGIYMSASFTLQLRNPKAPVTGGQRIGRGDKQKADFPEEVMQAVFGVGEKGTDQSTGLRFASVNTVELLDYEGAELIFIAAHGDEEGVDKDLEEGRGQALKEVSETEGEESIKDVFKELAMDAKNFPAEALEGSWI